MKRLLACDLALDVLRVADPDLLLTHALQVFHPISDTTRDGEIRGAAPRFKKNVAMVSARRRATP